MLDVLSNKKGDRLFYLNIRLKESVPLFKLLIIQLKEGFKISNSIREQHFMIMDQDYSEQNDEYINQLKRYI